MDGLRLRRINSLPPNRLLTAEVAVEVLGHKALTAIPFDLNSPAITSTHNSCPILPWCKLHGEQTTFQPYLKAATGSIYEYFQS